MSLLAFNKTGAPILLGDGGPPFPTPVTLPLSPSPPSRGPAVNVTSECHSLNLAQYTAIALQVSGGFIDLEWTVSPEYPTPGLASIELPGEGPHALSHETDGGSDPLIAKQHATGLTVLEADTPINQSFHETFFKIDAVGTVLGTIDDDDGNSNPSVQPSHPLTLDVEFPPGWLGGSVVINGKNSGGFPESRVYTDSSGGAGMTVFGTLPFASIDPVGGISNTTPGGVGATTASVKTGAAIGVSGDGDFPSDLQSFYKVSLDGVSIAFTDDPPNDTFTPSVPPDGSGIYEVWYVHPHDHPHTHSVGDAGHEHDIEKKVES